MTGSFSPSPVSGLFGFRSQLLRPSRLAISTTFGRVKRSSGISIWPANSFLSRTEAWISSTSAVSCWRAQSGPPIFRPRTTAEGVQLNRLTSRSPVRAIWRSYLAEAQRPIGPRSMFQSNRARNSATASVSPRTNPNAHFSAAPGWRAAA